MANSEWTPGAETWRKYAKLIARYWADEDFATALRSDPRAELEQAGIDIPEGIEVVFAKSPDELPEYYLLIPAKPEPLVEGLSSVEHDVLEAVGIMSCRPPYYCCSGCVRFPPTNDFPSS